jgi:endonuclease I
MIFPLTSNVNPVRIHWLFALLFFTPAFLLAQPLTADPSALAFGNTTETQRDSLALTLRNPHDFSVHISECRFYATYGEPAFAASMDTATLAPGQSLTIQVYFQPRHNIAHNSELLIQTSSPRGALRVDLRGQGVFSNGYYQSTQNLSEEALKSALHTRLGQGYQSLGYNAARDAMFMDIDNQRLNGQGASVNTLEGVYTGFTLTSYSNRSNAQNQGMNTEHTWPQSLFNQDEPMRSDLFHLFPTQQNANSQRANFPFGEVSNPSWQQGGSQLGNGVFEPRDQQKGSTARGMMYFVLRYQNYSNFLNSQEAVLRQWHATHAPDQVERARNQAIFSRQNNRNPFIDYPQLIERIQSLSSNSVAPPVQTVDLSTPAIDFDTVAIGDTAIFTYVVVNTGNQPLTISAEAVDNPQLALAPGLTVSGSIAAGEAGVLAVRLIGMEVGTLVGQLTFGLNVPGQASVQVPINAEVVARSDTNTSLLQTPGMAVRWQLSPNPARSSLKLTRSVATRQASQGQLLNAQGQVVLRWDTPAGATEQRLDLRQLPRGMYWVKQAGEPSTSLMLW